MSREQRRRRDNSMQFWGVVWWRCVSVIGMGGALLISANEKLSLLVIAAPLCLIVGALLWMGAAYAKGEYFFSARGKVKFLQRLMYLTTAIGIGLLGVIGIIGPHETKTLLLIPGLFWVLSGAAGLLLEPEVARLEEK